MPKLYILRECHSDWLDALERDYYQAAVRALTNTAEYIGDIDYTTCSTQNNSLLNTHNLDTSNHTLITDTYTEYKNIGPGSLIKKIKQHLK